MNTVKVRNIEIGSGVPKICIPIVGITQEEVLKAAREIKKLDADVVEWRVDWFEEVWNGEKIRETLLQLRKILEEIPLLFTFRTLNEGGEKAAQAEDYVNLNQAAIETGCIDLVDVELFTGDEAVRKIVERAHEHAVGVVMSSHDFQKTPSQEEIVSRLIRMQQLGADIPKIAVMPRCKKDVLTLLAATEEMSSEYADRPIITMSMASDGMISRLCGEVFGSALTFGAAGEASAPGQMEAGDLRTVLDILHKGLDHTEVED